MAKRVYIIHGWAGRPDEAWFPWIRKQLEEKDFEVFAPAMPDPDYPKIEVWVQFLENLIDSPDKNTYFVGHSSGSQAIMRYLEKLPEDIKVGGCVFVAGWSKLKNLTTEEDWDIAKPWMERIINFEKVKRHAHSLVAVFSENDPYVDLENKTLFEENLGAKTILDGHKGHFDKDDGIIELPVVLRELLKMIK